MFRPGDDLILETRRRSGNGSLNIVIERVIFVERAGCCTALVKEYLGGAVKEAPLHCLRRTMPTHAERIRAANNS